MGEDLKEEDFTEERIAEVRTAARELMDREGMSITQAGKEVGIGSTFSMFMNGNYPGKNNAVALKVQRWLTARQSQAATAAKLPSSPAFILTRTAKKFGDLFEHAHYAPDFGVVLGEPGLGKTTAARAYTRTTPSAWMMTCQPVTGSAYGMLSELSDTLGVGQQDIHGYKLSRLITRKLSGLRGLLIVDEAQHLTVPALDQLRSFHDAAGCGIVLMGNPSIMRNLEGGRRSADYAQLFSRIGQRINQRKPASDDIEAILTAWAIEDAAVRKVARAVARKPGALRTMDKVLRQAHLRAQAEGVPVEERHMLQSAQQLGDEKPLEIDA